MKTKELGKNSLYSLIKSISTVAFPLITFPYISRVLQPENIGKYNFSNSIVSYFSLIASLGITTYAVRECSKYKKDKNALSKTASEIYSINICSTLISYLLLLIAVLTIPILHNYYVLIMIQSISIAFTTIGADWINTAEEDFRYITVRTLLFQLISIILMLVFVKKSDDYIKYAIIVVISSGGANLTNMFYRKRYCKIYFTFHLNLKKHLGAIISLFAMILAQQIFVASDTTMIGFFCGDYEVGLYSTAIKVYNVVNQLIVSITWVVMPQLSLCFSENNRTEGHKVLEYAYQFLITLGLPCVIGLLLFSKQIIYIVGGNSYIEANQVMKILAVTLFFSIVACFLLNINILAAGKDKVGMVACIVPAIFNFVTNYIFIPKFGIEAAAWTTVCSQFVIILICIPFVPEGYEIITIIVNNWKPLVASGILMICCKLFSIVIDNMWYSFIASIGFGGCLYIIFLYITKYDFIMKLFFDKNKGRRE